MKKPMKLPEVRRFEPGASGLPSNDMLLSMGYKVVGACASYLRIVGPKGGRPKNIGRKQISELLDRWRVANGLEPIRKAAND